MGWLRRGNGGGEGVKIDNLFGAGTTIKGAIKAQGNVRIEGGLEGELSCDGHVIISKGADLRATVVAQSAQVAGIVHGDICVEGRLEILDTGRVWGDVQVGSLQIAEGGLLRGACVMSGEEEGSRRRRGRGGAADSPDEGADAEATT